METLEDVCAMLRSVLQSTQEGVRLDRVESDYRTLTGEFIPYRKLKFHSLEAFLKSMPNVVRITRSPRGELMVQAVSDSSTEHIASLVARQRSNKSRTRFTSSHRPLNGNWAGQPRRPTFRPYNGSTRVWPSNTRPYPSAQSSWHQQRLPPLPHMRPNYSLSYAPPATSRAATPGRQNKHTYQPPPRFQKQKQAQRRSPSPPPPSPPPVSERRNHLVGHRTNKQLLEEYAKSKGLGCLIFKTFRVDENTKAAKVKIQDQCFGSYPAGCLTNEEAEEEAAKNAVMQLGIQLDKQLKKKVTNDVNSMFDRIREVCKREVYLEGDMIVVACHVGWS